jgi:glycine betaine/proline transport system substrate-binding protein
LLFLTVGTLATGCSGLGAVSGGKQLTLGYIGWDENVAVSTLTKVLLEEKLGYIACCDEDGLHGIMD